MSEGKYIYFGHDKQPSPTGETVATDSATGGRKATKMDRFDLIPAIPLRLLALHYGHGSTKYADRNWELGYSWSLSYAALMRHVNAFWRGEDYDAHKADCKADCKEHSGAHHLIAAAWHCFAMVEWGRTHPEKDDRPQPPRWTTK